MRAGHKSGRSQQRLDALSYRQVVLMLLEQDQLIEDYCSQGQQLRPLQALHGHLHAPLKDILEQAVEGFNGLRPQLMEDFAHFYSAITMRMWPASSRH